MGYLLIDHSQGQWIDGKPGEKWELETKHCCHCGRCIAILKRPTETAYLANIDLGKAIARYKDGSGTDEYVGKRQCYRCQKNICRLCAWEMEVLGDCPGPFHAQFEHALATGGAPYKPHNYGAMSHQGK